MANDIDVLLLAGDEDGGCGFYRMREPARVINAQTDLKVTVQTSVDADTIVQPNGDSRIVSIGVSPDVIVFQRPMISSLFALMQYAQNRGIACIVEIDDDLEAIHKDNIAFSAVSPSDSKISNWSWLRKCCDIADLVITSTPNLAARYASHGRFEVIRNLIPEEEFLRPIVSPDQLRLGWTGTLQTHPEDLDEAGAHIATVLRNHAENKTFTVVGDGYGVKEKLYLTDDLHLEKTGWVPRDEYMQTMADNIDIGIVPLKLDTFNFSKSWLKSLEMASQGIPSVSSPTPENILLSKTTGNPLAYKGRDWQKHLKRLLTDRDFYLERSENVRVGVRHMTYENYAVQWVQAWDQALKNRKAID